MRGERARVGGAPAHDGEKTKPPGSCHRYDPRGPFRWRMPIRLSDHRAMRGSTCILSLVGRSRLRCSDMSELRSCPATSRSANRWSNIRSAASRQRPARRRPSQCFRPANAGRMCDTPGAGAMRRIPTTRQPRPDSRGIVATHESPAPSRIGRTAIRARSRQRGARRPPCGPRARAAVLVPSTAEAAPILWATSVRDHGADCPLAVGRASRKSPKVTTRRSARPSRRIARTTSGGRARASPRCASCTCPRSSP